MSFTPICSLSKMLSWRSQPVTPARAGWRKRRSRSTLSPRDQGKNRNRSPLLWDSLARPAPGDGGPWTCSWADMQPHFLRSQQLVIQKLFSSAANLARTLLS